MEKTNGDQTMKQTYVWVQEKPSAVMINVFIVATTKKEKKKKRKEEAEKKVTPEMASEEAMSLGH